MREVNGFNLRWDKGWISSVRRLWCPGVVRSRVSSSDPFKGKIPDPNFAITVPADIEGDQLHA